MVIKLAYSEARQRFGELCLRVLDRDALHVDDNELVEERLRTLALPIAAGASQIQRNIISERLLGHAAGAAVTMDLDLDDDQIALRDGIAALLAGRFDTRPRPRRLRPGDVRRARGGGRVLAAAPTGSRGPTRRSCSSSSAATACPDHSSAASSRTTAIAGVVERAEPVWVEHLDVLESLYVIDGAR